MDALAGGVFGDEGEDEDGGAGQADLLLDGFFVHRSCQAKTMRFPCARMGRAGSPCPPVSVMPKDGAGNVRTHVFPSPG